MKVSVITVCFNSSKTIRDTMDSIVSQSYLDIEHIVVDGGSTDNTLKILDEYKKNISILISEPDYGIYDAMNKGLLKATGEVVGFLNSDDFYADSSVVEQIANTFQDAKVDACFANLLYVSHDNKKIIRYWKSKPFEKGDFALGWCPAHPTFYFRRKLIDVYGVFDRQFKIAADVEFMMRYLESGAVRFSYIDKVWVRMRIGGETNKSLKNIVFQNKEVLRGLEKNSIKYSTLVFGFKKITSRLLQFVMKNNIG